MPPSVPSKLIGIPGSSLDVSAVVSLCVPTSVAVIVTL